MNRLAEGIHDGAIRLGQRLARVVGEQGLLLGAHDPRLLELGEVATEVGLIQLQDGFKVTDAQGPLVQEIEDAESVRIRERLEDLGYFHEHRVIQSLGDGYSPCRRLQGDPAALRIGALRAE